MTIELTAKAISYLRGHDSDQQANLRTFVSLLKSNEPLDRDLRHALALMFDPRGLSAFKIQRRNKGNPAGPIASKIRKFEIGMEVESRVKALRATKGPHPSASKARDSTIKRAQGDVAAKFGLSDSAVKQAHKFYKDTVGRDQADGFKALSDQGTF